MAETVRLDVLAIAAHPDDAEITCGGLLLKMVGMGRKVGILDLARGEMGTYGDEHIRAREAAAAARIMGLAWRGNSDLPDAAIEYHHENKLVLAQTIRETKPELVILPHWSQRHPDHLACSRLGYDACYLAGLAKLPLTGEPHRPRKIIYASYYRNTDYSFFVDIGEVFELKLRAIAAYQSQFGDPSWVDEVLKGDIAPGQIIAAGRKDVFSPGTHIFDLLYSRARTLGHQVGVTFAEAYTIKEQILIDDPQKMPVRSI
ncbi:MAG: bacillithiol biosynthesis deacetylase BshB1 [Candidatus Zixiibacteriota bacterium]